jgi:Protein of unknown function (DUF2752)
MIPASASVRERDLRIAMGGLVGIALVWPLSPVHPDFACPMRTITGIPCPFCGMTRSVVAAAHGHLLQSLSFNPLGIAVLAFAVVAIVRPSLLRVMPPTWVLITVMGALWIWNIGFNPTFSQLFLR